MDVLCAGGEPRLLGDHDRLSVAQQLSSLLHGVDPRTLHGAALELGHLNVTRDLATW